MKKVLRLLICAAAIVSVLSLLCFAAVEEIELFPGDTMEYTLEKKDKVIYNVYLEEDGLLALNVTSVKSEAGRQSIGITIEGEEQEFYYETQKNFKSEKAKILQGFPEGEYTIEIENLSPYFEISFSIETAFYERENFEGIGNSDFDTAFPLELGTEYAGGIITEGEYDFFRFEMPFDGYAYIRTYSPDYKIFTLYDENKEEIGHLNILIEENGKVDEQRAGLKKGTYYISVSPEYDCTDPIYLIKVNARQFENTELEYNNTKESAQKIAIGTEYHGDLFGEKDEDVFSFNVTKESDVEIKFVDAHLNKDGHYSIWISDGKNEIAFSDRCGSETLSVHLLPGTYYFCVSSLGRNYLSSLGYRFRVSASEHQPVLPDNSGEEEQEDEAVLGTDDVKQFTDVSDSDWFAPYLLSARQKGLITGLENGTYAPKNSVSVAEAITMAVREAAREGILDYDAPLDTDAKWYEPYVGFALKAGIISEGDFDSYERNATRAEIAYIFANLFDGSEDFDKVTIPDVDEGTKHSAGIHKLYSLGILKGDDENGTFYPERELTRAEAAVILLRISEKNTVR